VLFAVIAGGLMLSTLNVKAQWWSHAPADFEECADSAEKLPAKADRVAALTACNAKFAGRRKPGGGYTYYDFMQDRNFDIAGPNPTPEEQKKIDQKYTEFLDRQRGVNARAAAAQPAQPLLVPSLSSRPQPAALDSQSLPVAAPAAPKAPVTMGVSTTRAGPAGDAKSDIRPDVRLIKSDIKPKPNDRSAADAAPSFAAQWPRLSQHINDLKRLFGLPPG
jgi:hypothetical protein